MPLSFSSRGQRFEAINQSYCMYKIIYMKICRKYLIYLSVLAIMNSNTEYKWWYLA